MALPHDVDGTFVNGSTSYDAGELRLADAALVAQAGIGSGLTVSVDGSDVVTVQPGSVVISGEDAVVGTGVYRAGIASAVTGGLSPRNGVNGRIDLVVFRQLDSDVVGAHAAKTARIEIIAGTPSATPVVPTRPSMAVELARITVPASGGGSASVNSANRVSARAVGVPLSRSGRFTGTTDASGNLSWPHGLGVVPSVVQITPEVTGNGIFAGVYRAGVTSTNLQVVCYTATAARVASTSVTINWTALA